MGGRGRPVLIGAGLGLLLVLGLLGYVAYGGLLAGSDAPDSMMIIALAEDSDGAQVAALIGVVDANAAADSLEVIDPMLEVESSGTSYSLLKDQYPFGGGGAVAAAAGKPAAEERMGWVALPAETWTRIIDSAGGLEHEVPTPVNAYVGGELFVIDAGTQVVSGAMAHALTVSALHAEANGQVSDVESLANDVLEVVVAEWPTVVEAVAAEEAKASVGADVLQNILQ